MDYNATNRIAFTDAKVRDTLAYLKKKKRSGPVPSLVTRYGKALTHRKGRLYISGYEVVPQGDRNDRLKHLIYEEDSTAPFGRDSLFHDIKNRKLIGLTRRFVFAYLRRQPIVSSRRSKPKRIFRKNVATLQGTGMWATDLVHVRVKDVPHDWGNPTTQRKFHRVRTLTAIFSRSYTWPVGTPTYALLNESSLTLLQSRCGVCWPL